MSYIYKVAVIGNGSTTVNALHALDERYQQSPSPLPLIEATIFGNGPEEDCGKGFAYGPLGGAFGNFTESPIHADYGSAKGAFRDYAAKLLRQPSQAITFASRKLVGNFHASRYAQLKREATELGLNIAYQRGYVTDVKQTPHGAAILADKNVIGYADHAVLAVGDILSTRFGSLVARRAGQIENIYEGQVFGSSYHAIPHILDGNGEGRVVVALGTRSSFIDLANGLIAKGYKGKIIGISSTGQTSWQARDESYPLSFLSEERPFETAQEVLAALHHEFSVAREKGVWIPGSLFEKTGAFHDTDPQRLTWDFDFAEEAAHADDLTYHTVVQKINWEKIYENLLDDKERSLFRSILSDFILYNRVNTVVPEDFRTFAANIANNVVEIRRDSFAVIGIRPALNGRIHIPLRSGASIDADYIVNCAIGPASSLEQVEHSPLLRNLVNQGVLQPLHGTGFSVNEVYRNQISLLGVQARPYPFSSIGIENNGRQIEAWTSTLVGNLLSSVNPPNAPRPSQKGFHT